MLKWNISSIQLLFSECEQASKLIGIQLKWLIRLKDIEIDIWVILYRWVVFVDDALFNWI